MSRSGDRLSATTSLCPTCLERVPGWYEERDGAVYLGRTCPEHGEANRKVWGSQRHWEWAGAYGPNESHGTGLRVDNGHACLAVIEVTNGCNLSCSYCFASSGPSGRDRSFEDIVKLLRVVRESGGPRPIQFSGGEPTIRDDLPELVGTAREMGFQHIQINTNGLVLANADGYADRLAAAGVTAVYLQFDGLTSETYEAIRGVDITAEKHQAVDACRRADLPVVLVPTIVPGINDHELGPIVRFAMENIDIVQSVNFQPVAHFGRYGDHNGRVPLDEVTRRLADQIEPLESRDVLPIPCCSSYCQMATAFMPNDTGDIVPLTRFIDSGMFDSLAGLVDESDWMDLLAGTPLGEAKACRAADCCGMDVPDAGNGMLEGILPVSITGFMDADAADVDRLGNCCIAVPTPSGELVPFCAYNMTTEDGRYALRNRHGWGGRRAVTEAGQPSSGGSSDGARWLGDRGRVDQGSGCCGGRDCCGGG